MEQAGDDTALVPDSLRTAALTRVFGFEIMPAPFVIAHLQIASLLENARAPLADQHRAGVFLTNALTGWVPERHPQSVIFGEFEKEREDSEQIKQQGTILVILGNPPYNGYAGIATIDEERDLTTAYREQIPGLPAPQGQGLNDLYVRFFRIAERRIVGDGHVHGNHGGCGIVCLISNNAWLDGLSHVSMRKKYIDTFQSIYIDNLNGDKYRTGKTTPEGLPDPSAFSTPQNREGIQVGTAISTLVRTSNASTQAEVHLRDLWGVGKLAQLRREGLGEAESGSCSLVPVAALGNPLAQRARSAAYTAWLRLPELLPTFFPGIKTSRDPLVVDIDRERLIERMNFYLDIQNSDETVARELPGAMTDMVGFSAKEARRELTQRRRAKILLAIEGGSFENLEAAQKNLTKSQTERYCYRPFDLRWIYYEMHASLLDRPREDYWRARTSSYISMISAQSNRRAYDPPCITRSLASLHVVEKGSAVFPLEIFEESLFDAEKPDRTYDNISDSSIARYPSGTDPHDIFFHSLAIMHSTQYRVENAGALLGDWPRIPLPATAALLEHSAMLGRRLADLLDAESSINLAAEWSFLAALKLPLDPNLEEALKLTAGWGHKGQGSTVMPGRGKAPEREWSEAGREKLAALAATQSLDPGDALTLLGESCVDVYLNGEAHSPAVPINVWNYTLGGYQVLKKWLSYREFTAEPASPLLHRPLRSEEAAYFAQVVRRIAAILLLGPALDASYRAILPTAAGLPAADHH